jgi:hypothetical protein
VGLCAAALSILTLTMASLAQAGSPQVSVEIVGPGGATFEPLEESPLADNAAVFVGVNEFADRSLSPLNFAVNDAVEQAYLFAVELRLVPPRNCQLVLAGKPKGQVVERHLQELLAAGAKELPADKSSILQAVAVASRQAIDASSLLIVSFSSHGFDDGEGEAYLMPSGGLTDFLDDTALRLRVVEETMRKSKAGHRLLLVDACQQRLSGEKSLAPSDPGKAMQRAFVAALKRPTGQAKLASCSVAEESYEMPGLGGVGHGVFTFALLEALRGGAAPDADGLVRLGAVTGYVTRRVSEWVGEHRRKPQSPSYYGPEEARMLPLAEKGSDLATLAAALKKRIDRAVFTQTLCDEVLGRLKNARADDPASRDLLAMCREFAAGRHTATVFATYARAALSLSAPETSTLRQPEQAWTHLDPALLGEWELGVPTPQGVSLWVWKINADGSYTFIAHGPGAVPGHAGFIHATGGQWALHSTTMTWSDGGFYRLAEAGALAINGKLGTVTWRRKSTAVDR